MDSWSNRAWAAAVAGACLLAAVAATWPLVLHVTRAVPLGTETAATIPLFDIWTLWWSANGPAHAYAGFWDAPIFHPTGGAFALSEPMVLPGLLAAPFFALHAPPALCHNLVLLALLATNGVFGCRLARAFGASRAAALAAAVLVVTLPFFAKMQGELPILAVAGALAALDGVARFGAAGRSVHALQVAAGLTAQALCCEQLTGPAAIFVLGAALLALHQRGFQRAAIARLCAALALAAVLIAALARAPLAIHRHLGLQRSAKVVQSLSAGAADLFTRPGNAWLSFPAREAPDRFTGGLFPGVGLLLLAAAGVLDRRATGRRWRWYAVGAVIVADALALGLNLSLGGWRPFSWLRALPGVSQLRSPFRIAVFAQAHLACLAALGLDALARRLGRRALVLSLGLLAATENLSLPAPLLDVPPTARTPWTAFVAAQPAGTVVAHVPFPSGGDVEDLAPEAWRMFAQIDHGRPLVNGYASYFPPLHRELMFAMARAFPAPILACALHRAFGAGLLVVEQPWLAAHRAAFEDVRPLLTPAYAGDQVAIFRFTPTPQSCPPMRAEVGGGG
ncbi:MAG TPA: hypothetical protein VHO67_21500 [Polyangia bacterium]|nr:hypothetical protein [Polyangia bacterium]